MPTFTFETSIYRGRTEREVVVEAQYAYDGTGMPVLLAAYDEYGPWLSRAETESVKDAMADRCEADYAAWLADRDCDDAPTQELAA